MYYITFIINEQFESMNITICYRLSSQRFTQRMNMYEKFGAHNNFRKKNDMYEEIML